MDYDKIVVSIKSSNVKMNYDAHLKLKELVDCPIHIGITESGTPRNGELKSAVGIGALLLAGIGDTMRVSLTADPVKEVLFARRILETVGMRQKAIEVVSCPTCGRTEVNLEEIAGKVEERLGELTDKGIGNMKIAVMGCAVNGPGEAKGADIGVACGKGKGVLFAKGEVVRTVKEEDIVDELIRLAEEYEKDTGKFN